MLQTTVNDLAQAPLWNALPEIVFINLLLSGDNAVVIAMACRGLPRQQRIWGLAIGEAVAVVLLIVFAAVISGLLQFPYFKIGGGLALLYIAARLVVPENTGRKEIEPTAQLWRAVRIIAAADLVMSFDNILAIAQIAKGNLALLAIGLMVSIPIIIAGAALIAALLERLPILTWAGAALLGWVAGQTIADDKAVSALIPRLADDNFAGGFELAAGCAGAVLVIAAGALWRHRRSLKERPDAARGD